MSENVALGLESALIGHTGFVGSNLNQQARFVHKYNSKNIGEMVGRHYDLVLCAGVSAVKWWANLHPEEDAAAIQRLLDVLKTVRARRFVLISTIDVYADPRSVTESTPVDQVRNHPYGTHRAGVERFVRSHFPTSYVVRLPALFGPGLKKNVIYDLLHDNNLGSIHPSSTFQYYNLDRLWSDVLKIVELGLPVTNMATGPIETRRIVEAYFPHKKIGASPLAQAAYDMRSEYAKHWSEQPYYQYGAEAVFGEIGTFVASHGV